MKQSINVLKNDLFVAWLALVVTLAHAGINAVFYFRGSQVAAEPREVVIYLQSGTGGSSLSAAVELVITNGSPWYGDALVGAEANLVPASRAKVVTLPPYEGLVNPRFGAVCPSDGRCLNLASLSVQFLDDGIKSVPTSGAQVAWVSFEIPCAAFGKPCDRLDGLASMHALIGQEWEFRVTGDFVHEGEVKATCRFGSLGPKNFDSVRKYKWTSIKCRPEGT